MKWLCCVVLTSLIYVSDANGGRSITIIQSPEIPSGDNVVTDAGTRQTLTCKASNKDQKIKWLHRNTSKVPRWEDQRVFVKKHFVEGVNGSTPALDLVFTSLVPDDTGIWRCQSGKHTKDVTLCVIDRATFAETETQVTGDHGGSAELECVAQGEPRAEAMEWRRNGNVITDWTRPSKYSVMLSVAGDRTIGQLVVKSLTPEDAGVYTCVAVQASRYYSSFIQVQEVGKHGEQVTCKSRETTDITLTVNLK